LDIDEELCVCFIDWQMAKLIQILKGTCIDYWIGHTGRIEVTGR